MIHSMEVFGGETKGKRLKGSVALSQVEQSQVIEVKQILGKSNISTILYIFILIYQYKCSQIPVNIAMYRWIISLNLVDHGKII